MCNTNGNCHCNPGWMCPNCTEAYDGPGGSIDSGLKCQVPTATRTITPAPITTKNPTLVTNDEKNFLNIPLPLLIVAACFLVLLGVGIYCCAKHCCSRQNSNEQANHKQVNQGSHYVNTSIEKIYAAKKNSRMLKIKK